MLRICGTSTLSEVDFLLEIDFLSAIVHKRGREACVGEKRRKRVVLIILEDGTIIRLSCENAFVFCSSFFFIFFSFFLLLLHFFLRTFPFFPFPLPFLNVTLFHCIVSLALLSAFIYLLNAGVLTMPISCDLGLLYMYICAATEIINLMKDRDW